MAQNSYKLKVRQRLGKYRIERRIATGGFANVFEAYDTIEGIRVALKIPHGDLINPATLKDFRNEVRLTAGLEHPNILPIKTAGFIDEMFVVVYPLGRLTLDERLRKRMALRTALHYAEQLLEATAFAHEHRLIHCDIKPENCILFQNDRLRLADFGIAKVARKTLSASGAGTVGYIAPEQAMGKPSFRSDVFSIGLILFQMLTGELPEWPYHWPPPGAARLKGKVSPDMIDVIRRSIQVDAKKRFRDAEAMLSAFRRAKVASLQQTRRKRARSEPPKSLKRKWKSLREREFRRHYRKTFGELSSCGRCKHPVGEAMQVCPWCGFRPKVYRGPSGFPARCSRCARGMKLDWRYCPWCFGPGYEPANSREYSDVRYSAKCANPRCDRKDLMPFMRYCPWCKTKVKRKWKVPDSNDKCGRCGWGVVKDIWDWCPWCGKALKK